MAKRRNHPWQRGDEQDSTNKARASTKAAVNKPSTADAANESLTADAVGKEVSTMTPQVVTVGNNSTDRELRNKTRNGKIEVEEEVKNDEAFKVIH